MIFDGKQSTNMNIALSKFGSIETLAENIKNVNFSEFKLEDILLIKSNLMPDDGDIETVRNYLEENPDSASKVTLTYLFINFFIQLTIN